MMFFTISVLSITITQGASSGLGDFAIGVGIAQIIVGLAAVASLIFSIRNLRQMRSAAEQQRQHNELGIKPLPYVAQGNFVASVYVKLCNQGLGPLIIKDFIAIDLESGEEADSLLPFLPPQSARLLYDRYATKLPGRTIRSDGELALLELKWNSEYAQDEDYALRYPAFLKKVKASLSSLEVTVSYEDLYGNSYEAHRVDLRFMSPDNSAAFDPKKAIL